MNRQYNSGKRKSFSKKDISLSARVIAIIAAVCAVAALMAGYAIFKGIYKKNEPDKRPEGENVLLTENITDGGKTETSAETESESESESETESETEPTPEPPDDGLIHVTSLILDRYSLNLKVGESEMPMVTMYPENAVNKGEIWSSSDESVAVVNRYGKVTAKSTGVCTVSVVSEDNPSARAEVSVTVSGASDGLTYIDGILIVNKTYSLPADYNPGTDPAAAAALDEMFKAAAKDGISLWIASGFRSYERQKTLYNNYVAADGRAEADRYSARPGHSEHQTGLAFDLNTLEQSFGTTPEGIWIRENSWKYGFIIRYPQEKESVTGYMYEPWHVRYLGKDIAKAVYRSGLCLEEYLGITSVYAEN